MKTIRPSYYDDFACLAGDCPYTCCQEWKIAVDEKTERTWHKVPSPVGMTGRAKHGSMLKDVLVTKDGDRVIGLRRDGKCPFLQADGLCAVVREYGEGMLSDTCHVYPREWHDFADRTEGNLMMGCPQALKLLWEQETFTVEADDNTDTTEYNSESTRKEFSGFLYIRDFFVKAIQDESRSIREHLLMMEYVLLDFLSDEKKQTVDYIRKTLKPETLKPLYEALAKLSQDPMESLTEQNELFLDIIENYRKEGRYKEILTPLAEVAESIEAMSEDIGAAPEGVMIMTDTRKTGPEDRNLPQAFYTTDNILDFRKAFENICKRQEHRIRLLLAEEIYGTLYLPEGDLTSITMKLQWLAITYTVTKHACFLDYLLGERSGHSDRQPFENRQTYNRQSDNRQVDDLQADGICRLADRADKTDSLTDRMDSASRYTDIIITFLRMTGYTDEDIEEYLEESFESPVWEWGYMMLILD